MDKKSIERLFQEKFKDFEVSPPPNAWRDISNRLDKEKKKRVYPFWWWYGGVAAIFIIGLFSALLLNEKGAERIYLQKDKIESVKESIVLETKATQDSSDKNNLKIDVLLNLETKKTSNNATVSNEGFKKNITVLNIRKQKKKSIEDNEHINSNHFIDEFFVDNKEKSSLKENESIVFNSLIDNDSKYIQNKSTDLMLEDSLLSTVEINKEKNALEELLLEKESLNEKESPKNRWQVSTALAPVFFNSNSKDSPIDPVFNNNSKDFDNSFSFGIGIYYAVNEKLKLRSGIHRISMGQTTNDVMFYPDLNGFGLSNVVQKGEVKMMVLPRNLNNVPLSEIPRSVESSKIDGQLSQQIGFVEVPMELSYKLVNKKVGVNLIGGMSALLLTDNQIRVNSTNASMILGEANNINPVHFSTNIGLGVDYQFLKSFRASVEPMFKYQLNTFSNNSGNFRPYFIGIYSGISYQF